MSDLNIMVVQPDGPSAFEPRRFFVDVNCSDLIWPKERRRIEIHMDVAKHIYKQEDQINKLHRALKEIIDIGGYGVASEEARIAKEALRHE